LAAPDCTLLMPIKGSVLTALYAFCLLLPLGYVGGE